MGSVSFQSLQSYSQVLPFYLEGAPEISGIKKGRHCILASFQDIPWC